MASYTELRSLFMNSDLRNKVSVACIVAAEAIRSEDVGTTNHTNRMLWAKAAFDSPDSISNKMLMAVLAANKDLTLSAITAATDAAIQANVAAAVDVFADGS
jgi:hypothetical protein